ncbi:hypothetical protein GY45DRAFT_431848 [Cubamyces sp. BRFM 1775]|nr:hypothetical protein GY45DRAFT_431848 [Cubamyces sp. BRFM 1775]
MACLSTSHDRAQPYQLCILPPIHTAFTNPLPPLLKHPHTMHGSNGFNSANRPNLPPLGGLGGYVFDFIADGPPAPVQVPTLPRSDPPSTVINFAKEGGRPLFVKDVLEGFSQILRGQMEPFPNWKDFEYKYAYTGIRLAIYWPGYEIYDEWIKIGGTEGVKSPVQLLVAVALVYNNFVKQIKQHRPMCKKPGWSISANSKYDVRNIELVSLISYGTCRFELTVRVHTRPRMM